MDWRLLVEELIANPILDMRISVLRPDFVLPNAQGTPWNLKRGGLESSGQRLISLIGKTKSIAFFLAKNLEKKDILGFWRFEFF